jgi:hypothetical protein
MDIPEPARPLLSALRCWIEGRRIYLEITARRTVSFPASKYAALASATQADLGKISLHSDGRYIRWETLDEEICVDDVANNRFVHTPRPATV